MLTRRSALRGVLAGAGAALGGALGDAATAARIARDSAGELGPSLTIRPGREFAADSYVHRALAPDAELDPRSDVWVSELQRQIATFFGHASVNIDQYAPPLYLVGPDQPTVRVKAERSYDPDWSFPPLQAQWDAVPLPDHFRPARGTDREAIVYQPSSGRYWEFWLLERTGAKVRNSAGRSVDEWRAAWGGEIANLASNRGYFETTPEGYTFGTAATGLTLLAGLMTVEEQRSGVIEHALHLSIPETRERSVWAYPAQRSDGQVKSEQAIPEGATFRLPADLDLDALDMDPYARMIARAVQAHGMVLRDLAGSVTFYAENPAGRYDHHPYYGRGGVLDCPAGRYEWACATPTRLRGFPWARLQALNAVLNIDM